MTDPGGSAATTTLEADLEEVERDLKAELLQVRLVGEIDLDFWHPLAEAGLATRNHLADPAQMSRLWPACLVTYLVGEGLVKYEDAGFWDRVSLSSLRNGQEAGPAFAAALRSLGLPTFEDLEENEGIAKHSRNRWIRRIHLHGGLPRTDVGRVLDLLAVTLRSGLRSASEVVDGWSTIDLTVHLRRKAPVRLLTYTGDFGIGLVDELISLLRAVSRGEDLESAGVASHLVDGAREWLEQRSNRAPTFSFTPGPRVRLEPGSSSVPVLRVPKGEGEEWLVDGASVGHSSRQVERDLPLAPPSAPGGWVVATRGERDRHIVSETPTTPVFVFDERGRLHHRATTLGGLRASVVAHAGTEVDASIDRRAIDGDWYGFEVIDVDLRACPVLTICPPSGPRVEIPVDIRLDVRLVGDRVDGLAALDGAPVFGSSIRIAFGGFVPEPSAILVAIDGKAFTLDRCPEHDGEFELSGFLPAEGSSRSILVVARADDQPSTFTFARIPGLRVAAPRLAPPTDDVAVTLTVPEAAGLRQRTVTIPGSDDHATTRLVAHGIAHDLTVTANRLRWDVIGPHTVVNIAGDRQFVVRLTEVREQSIDLRTGGVSARVVLLDAGATHEEWARRDRRDPLMSTARLRGFADTARAAPAARTRVAIDRPGMEPIEIGVIEGRYEPWSLEVDHVADEESMLIDVRWEELTEWPGRVVRLWAPDGDKPIANVDVADGNTSVQLMLAGLAHGRYLVEVAAATGWGTPRRPDIGPGCVSMFLGSPDADALRRAVLAADRRLRFDDATLNGLVPLLADLVQELMPRPDATAQRQCLIERIADDHWRAVDVILELAGRLGVAPTGAGNRILDPLIIELLPYLFDYPIRNTTTQQAHLLDKLWLVAPLAASCLDAARHDSRCHDRWRYVTGCSTAVPRDVANSLAKVFTHLPKHLDWEGSEARQLGEVAWTTAIKRLNELQLTSAARSTASIGRPIARQARGLDEGATAPRWRLVPTRVEAAVQHLGFGAGWLTDIVTLACAHLDPEADVPRERVLELLLMVQGLAPEAVRCSLLLAATSLRILEDAGDLARLVT